MDILITKGDAMDVIEVRRDDGSGARVELPHKGPVPHDAVHFFVESTLAIDDAFWGMVANGRDPAEIARLAKDAGHASAARAEEPDRLIVRALQSERIVECFEADLWGGGGDPESFREIVKAGCEQSLVPDFPLADETIDTIRRQIFEFADRWAALPVGERCHLEWAGSRSAR